MTVSIEVFARDNFVRAEAGSPGWLNLTIGKDDLTIHHHDIDYLHALADAINSCAPTKEEERDYQDELDYEIPL